MSKIYFWQTMLTPHMTALAISLSRMGYDVIYVAEYPLSEDRSRLGWEVPDMKGIGTLYADNYKSVKSIICSAPLKTLHICQGLRKNGIVNLAQKELRRNGLRQWVIMETVNDNGFFGFIKRLLYRFLILLRQKDIEVILAIGWKTSDWLINLGFNAKKVFPFSYFLPACYIPSSNDKKIKKLFRFIFVGQLVPGKKLNLLILSLSLLKNLPFELVIVGDGPCKKSLQKYAEKLIPQRVHWKGTVKISKVAEIISDANCLVLPSSHDGWGAVVSESLIVGTPVVCSDACGAAEVVRRSGFGGVFKSDSIENLLKELKFIIKRGPLSNLEKNKLLAWSDKITSVAGAQYLANIINFIEGSACRPAPPWLEK